MQAASYGREPGNSTARKSAESAKSPTAGKTLRAVFSGSTMSVVVTRAAEKKRSDEMADGNAEGSDKGSEGSTTGSDLQTQLEVQKLELEKLKMQLELERIKLAQMQASPKSVGSAAVSRSRVGEYARELKSVLAPMPVSEPLVPAWFKSVETMFSNFEVPEDVQGAIILPYLTEKMRAVATHHGQGGILAFKKLKEKVLAELKLTANEYSRLFNVSRKAEGESWSQFASNLQSLYDHYLESRQIKTLDDLKELVVSDRLKRVLPEDVRSYVILNETGEWLKPMQIAQLASNFEDSNAGRKKQRPKGGGNGSEGKDQKKPENGSQTEGGLPDPMMKVKCHGCHKYGHYRRDCPEVQSRRSAAVTNRGENSQDKLTAKVTVLKSWTTREIVGKEVPRQTEKSQELIFAVQSGENNLRARLDTGADITVVRRSCIPSDYVEQSCSDIKLVSAFGDIEPAKLMYVPLGLVGQQGEQCQQVKILCAAVDRMADEVDVLLNPVDHEDLIRIQDELEKDAKETLEGEKRHADEARTDSDNLDLEVGQQLEFEEEDENETEVPCVFAVESESNEVATSGQYGEESQSFRDEQRQDETLADAWNAAKEGTHGMFIEGELLYHADQISRRKCRQLVLPKSRRAEVLKLAHDSPWGGHFSQKKTKQRVKSAFYWPTVASDIKRYCQACHSCQIFSRPRASDQVPITPLTRPEQPFQTIFLDCIGPLEPPSSRGHRYALCIVDLCTRWPEVVPLKSLTAKATCQALVDVFSRFGTPQEICCDQGSNFKAGLTRELTEKMGATVRFSTPEHPQSNGLVERWNATFKSMLRHVVNEHSRDWDRYIPCLLWAYREVPNETTGVSPFELMFGRIPTGPLSILERTWAGEWIPPAGLNKPAIEYLTDLRCRMAEAADRARVCAEERQAAYAHQHNLRARTKTFNVGDKVLVLEPETSGKLKARWRGPAIVKERKRSDSYIVKLDDERPKWVHANKLRPYITRVNAVGVIFENDTEFGEVESTPSRNSQTKPSEMVKGCDSLQEAEKKELEHVLSTFEDVFADKPGKCKVGSHSIRVLENQQHAKSYNYRVPIALRAAVEKQIAELREWGMIYPVDSSFAHPIVCVAKRDGSVRMCIDYRQLNQVSETDSFPMHNVSELLYTVANAKFISVLDMTRGYWQIPVNPESQKYTAFQTPYGLYAWRVMPYGLKNSAATFQRVMNEVLHEHREYASAYIDDVAIYSNSWEEHLDHLRKVLETIRKVGLTVKAAKCRFAQRSVKYLGHVVGSGCHAPDSERIEAVSHLKPPTTKKDLRSMLGLFNYYREYVPNYSQIALPLTQLTGKRIPNSLPWNEDAQAAFETIKSLLAAIPKLRAPDLTKEFTLTTDASEKAVGACLSQCFEGENVPIAFFSRKLSPAQAKWSTIEREAFAIVWALGRVDTWVFGATINVVTDHNPLVYLARSAGGNARLTRWSLALQKYNLKIAHIKGTLNKCADALSRLDRDQ